MKFALRDDDLNFFFNVSDIEKWYKNIWNICPVSMSAIPFVKGNWKINTNLLEKLGPNNIDDNVYLKIKSDVNLSRDFYQLSKGIKLWLNLHVNIAAWVSQI